MVWGRPPVIQLQDPLEKRAKQKVKQKNAQRRSAVEGPKKAERVKALSPCVVFCGSVTLEEVRKSQKATKKKGGGKRERKVKKKQPLC